MIDKYLTLYDSGPSKWDDLSGLVSSLGWEDETRQSTMEYLDNRGVSKLYSRELVEAATRVNYGQVSLLFVSMYHLIFC